MDLIIAAVLAYCMESILKLLLKGSLIISSSILDNSITSFQNGGNIIESAMELLYLDQIPLDEIFIGIGKGLILTLFLLQLVAELAKMAAGEEAEHPLKITLRCITTYLLLVLFFGSDLFADGSILNEGLLKLMGRFGAKILSQIQLRDISEIETSFTNSYDFGDISQQFGAVVMYGALLGSVLGASISYVERVLSLALTALLGPLCIALYAIKDEQRIARQWLGSILVQILCIFVSLCMWSLFLQQLCLNETTTLFHLAVQIVILNLMKDSEQIFKALGFNTMPNIDTAKAMMGGIANTTSVFKASGKAIEGFGKTTKHVGKIASFMKQSGALWKDSGTIREVFKNSQKGYSHQLLQTGRDVKIGQERAKAFWNKDSNGQNRMFVLAENSTHHFDKGEKFDYGSQRMMINGHKEKINGKTYYEAERYDTKKYFGLDKATV